MPDFSTIDLDHTNDSQPLAELQNIEDVLAAIERSMMPGAAPLTSTKPTIASSRAIACYQANLQALRQHHADLAVLLERIGLPSLRWMVGRDGSLVARDAQNRWVGGSSLPMQVARGLFKKTDAIGNVLCLLSPGTAQQTAAALERVAPSQAVIAIIPDENNALMMLHAHDFSRDLAACRLWLVCGASWEQGLSYLLSQHGGLCVPQQYLRTALLDESTLQTMVQAGNRAFALETARRAHILNTVPAQAGEGTLVVGTSAYNSDHLSSVAMLHALGNDSSIKTLDAGHPMSASSLALAQAARASKSIISADVFRADSPTAAPIQTRWITWVTVPRLAPFMPTSPDDRILLADPSWKPAARKLGWPEKNITTAGWPILHAPSGSALVMLADAEFDPKPARLQAFSSHALLWEAIARELLANPFALATEPLKYLTNRAGQLNIDPSQLDSETFTARLILPAWRVGVAKMLAGAGLPLALYGRGWDSQQDLARYNAGSIESLADWHAAAANARACVRPAPGRGADAVDMLGCPVIAAWSDAATLVREARAALSPASPKRPITTPALAPALIASLIA